MSTAVSWRSASSAPVVSVRLPAARRFAEVSWSRCRLDDGAPAVPAGVEDVLVADTVASVCAMRANPIRSETSSSIRKRCAFLALAIGA
jgi:hypothetical protein